MAERRILETTQLLGALSPEALESLRAASEVREVARNEVLFRRGDDSSELFGIVSGRVAILTRSLAVMVARPLHLGTPHIDRSRPR